MGSAVVGRPHWRISGCGILFFSMGIFFNGVTSSLAQTASGNGGLCSTTERSTVTFQETYQVSRSQKSYTKCGFLGWVRCTQYSVAYTTQTRVAYRDTYNIVFTCCNGWAMQPDGSCLPNASDETTTESHLTEPFTTSKDSTTPPTVSSHGITALAPKWSSPSPTAGASTGAPGSPSEISKVDGPRTLGKGGDSPSGLEGEDMGMIGGLVGVAAALVILVSLIAIFVTRRRRRAREKRRISDPNVVFHLLNSSSPARAPVPDIYAEIPDRDGNATSPGAQADNPAPKDISFDDYDITFINTNQQSGLGNTYQDLKEAGSPRRSPREASGGSPAMKKADMEITLGPNGAVYTKTRQTENSEEVKSPYQNLPGLDTVIQAPDIYDVVGGNEVAPTAYNHLDGANAIPTDPEDEAYNMIVIGQSNTKREEYDRLDRQRGGSRISGGDQLDTPIPVASGYSALGLESHNGYDKLERPENHAIDTDRKTGPNTYDELGARGRSAEYDKLTRQGSVDRGLNNSGVPNGILVDNHYDTIEVKKPADGEIYENLPKKTPPKLKLPGPEPVKQEPVWSPDENTPLSPPLSAPVVRPVYDVVPSAKRMPTAAPVYDILPKSPGPIGGAPVYDTPPAVTKLLQQASIDEPIPPAVGRATSDEPTSPLVGGARPVYDTPPVRPGHARPSLQFDETCPLYENTPTSRKQLGPASRPTE